MDPLESVVTIYNRQIAGKDHGTSNALGGIICLWNDRAVATGDDILKMNPVYPSLLSFAERSWRGGGQAGWISNVSDGDKNGFADFENRLLIHKELYFRNKPFPYVRQTLSNWQLLGPFENKGNLSASFWPETEMDKVLNSQGIPVTGGTVVLRHWWAPLIKGAVKDPKENTTWYASSRIWNEVAGEKEFWIGFYNLSRSTATDSPPLGEWDNKKSAVWVNGNLVPPPKWKHGGQKGNLEIPLVDEGYEYRKATKIYLEKGWNSVLIKAPIGSFKGENWQNPVKWMFTFVPL